MTTEQNEKYALTEGQLTHVSKVLLPLLVNEELGFYQNVLRQPVVQYNNKEARYVRLKRSAVRVPPELTNDAIAMANFVLEQCHNRPANTDTPTFVVNTNEGQFDSTENLSIEWVQYIPLAEDEATELAHNMAKNKIQNFEFSCRSQANHKSTKQLIAYYQTTFPACFNFE